MRRPIFRFSALLAAALLPTSAHAAEKWLRADTANFIVYSSGSAKQLQDFATKVERFDAALRFLANRKPPNNPNRLTIYLLPSASDVGRLAGSTYTAGFYHSSAAGSYAVGNRDSAGTYELSGQQTLFHEYAHHFMYREMNAAYPAWYREGFADYVATVQFSKDGTWSFGQPAMYRAYDVFNTPIAIKKLLTAEVDGLNSTETAAFYAKAWLLVHMLSTDKEHNQLLKSYLQGLNEGEDLETAAAKLGDLKALDRDLSRYAHGRFSYVQVKDSSPYAGQVRVTEMDPVTSELIPLSLARRSAHEIEKTCASLRQLAARAATNAGVLNELAMCERDLASGRSSTAADNDDDDAKSVRDSTGYDVTLAEAAVDRALAAEPGNIRSNTLKAELMMVRLGKGPTKAQDWKDVRKYIARANHADPDDPIALRDYFDSFLVEGREPPKIAIDAIGQAFGTAPEANDLRVEYAFALANQGKVDEAIQLAKVVAYDPHAGANGKSLLQALEGMRPHSAERPAEPKNPATAPRDPQDAAKPPGSAS